LRLAVASQLISTAPLVHDVLGGIPLPNSQMFHGSFRPGIGLQDSKTGWGLSVGARRLFSLGGKEDHLIDLENDRHADVFANSDAIAEAGYGNQNASDLLAITLPTNKIGTRANNIKHYNGKMTGQTFRSCRRSEVNS
jgi:hypothetical protein